MNPFPAEDEDPPQQVPIADVPASITGVPASITGVPVPITGVPVPITGVPEGDILGDLHAPAVVADFAAGQPQASFRRRPRVWTLVLAFFVGVPAHLLASVAIMLVAALLIAETPLGSPHDLQGTLQQYLLDPRAQLAACGAGLVWAAISLLAAYCSPIPWRQRLNLNWPRISLTGTLLAVVATLSVGVVTTGLDGLHLLPESQSLEFIAEIINSVQGRDLGWAMLLIGVLPGITEELLFRGYLQTRLVERWGVHIGVWTSAFLFGLIHMDLVQGPFAMIMGLVLGYLTVWSGSILTAMLCHAVNNSTSVLLVAFAPQWDHIENPGVCLTLITSGLLAGLGSMIYLRTRGTQLRITDDALTMA